MTSDSDCINGYPKSVLRASAALQYVNAVDAAIYYGRDLSQYDRDVVWHVRQWQDAHDKRHVELASLSRTRAIHAAEDALKEAGQ